MSTVSPERILVILMGSLGDIARGFALLPPLKRKWPGASISWLVEPKWESIVRLHPYLSEVIVFDRPRGIKAALALRKVLRSRSFDLVLDLQRHFKSGLFSYFTGSALRIGFARRDSKEGNWLFNTKRIPAAANSETPKINQYLDFLTFLNIEPGDLQFGLESLSAKSLIAGLTQQLPTQYVALIMGSSWESKNWPLEGYHQAIERLNELAKLGIVLLGDRTQQALAAELVRHRPDVTLVDLTGRTTLPQLLGVLKAAAVCVGPDSGPGHLAAAVGTPTVTIFGPTSSLRTAPIGRRSAVIESTLGCAPCYRRRCPGLQTMCMRFHDPDLVVRQVLELAEVGNKLT